MQVRKVGLRLLAVALAGCAMPGCGSSDILADRELLLIEAGFRTDASSYAMAPAGVVPAATIRVTLDNRFGRTLIPVPCTTESAEWTLERREGERWVVAATPACDLVQSVPAPIAPGAEYRAVVRLPGRVQPGTYRLVFSILEVTDSATVPVMDGRARSNSFTLVD